MSENFSTVQHIVVGKSLADDFNYLFVYSFSVNARRFFFLSFLHKKTRQQDTCQPVNVLLTALF